MFSAISPSIYLFFIDWGSEGEERGNGFIEKDLYLRILWLVITRRYIQSTNSRIINAKINH
jgi:hypothetical protein